MSLIQSQCPICGEVSFADIEGPKVIYTGCGHSAEPWANRLACERCRHTTDHSLCHRCGAPTKPRWEVFPPVEAQAGRDR